jgi:hypothetical protein
MFEVALGPQQARVDEPREAITQLQELGRVHWPDLSAAQQFSRAFTDPKNAELARKAHQRPAPPTSYARPQ